MVLYMEGLQVDFISKIAQYYWDHLSLFDYNATTVPCQYDKHHDTCRPDFSGTR